LGEAGQADTIGKTPIPGAASKKVAGFMALTRQVITALNADGTDMLGTRNVAIKIVDDSIVSGSLLTVESNHFCILKSRGAVLQVYDTGQYALTTPDKPLIG
jgi:membrane protease subunit (stomatin/prohibitin family)